MDSKPATTESAAAAAAPYQTAGWLCKGTFTAQHERRSDDMRTIRSQTGTFFFCIGLLIGGAFENDTLKAA